MAGARVVVVRVARACVVGGLVVTARVVGSGSGAGVVGGAGGSVVEGGSGVGVGEALTGAAKPAGAASSSPHDVTPLAKRTATAG